MGAILSLAGPKCKTSEYSEVPQNDGCKRQKISSNIFEESPRLVSQKWKATIMTPELLKLRKELGRTEEWVYILTKSEDDKLFWHALDPSSRKWQRLPPLPSILCEEEPSKGLSGLWNMIGPSINIADLLRRWLGRKDAMDEIPFCGSAIGAVNGCIYLLGGFSRSSAMKCVWRFDPISNVWSEANPMSVGRAYCKTGILNNKLYVVGGVSRGPGGLSPLRSAEVYDPCSDTWSQVPSMPFSKAQALPTPFLVDMLKPIATGMISYSGRLCVPQSLYSWPFFVDVGGEMYDPETNSWTEMPVGMGEGWPARRAGTKVSVVVDDELYALDPSNSLDSGKIKVYDQREDAWKVVIGKVPICDFSDAESPSLLAAFHGKLHVIAKDASRQIEVLQADLRDDLGSSPSSSSSSPGSLEEHPDLLPESDTVVWKVIAARDFGSAELVSCQVLEI
ncbi:F-box/kelch-repeat protein At1g22040 isoform X2 [Tripterygium wilfordii]|uniref:F-box/kelch-repeat protein At1g22040 isoform X2 n=1 Tax=Tripterygium wilfordii TaxID=458696 RepID=UPI0018F82256|nr:F-box/kelch-repeat protein At1g22040 isoform X2 [Tripterygium wilfordii]